MMSDTFRKMFINHLDRKMKDIQSEMEKEETKKVDGEKSTKPSSLDSFTSNLCEKARLGEIDPLLGREEEVLRTVQVLSRRRKNNPLFLRFFLLFLAGYSRHSGRDPHTQVHIINLQTLVHFVKLHSGLNT